jgi:hypothetical protein
MAFMLFSFTSIFALLVILPLNIYVSESYDIVLSF